MSTEVDLDRSFNLSIKLMVLGNSGVGKTSFIYRYVDGTISNRYITTVGVDFREKTVEIPDQNRKVNLQVLLKQHTYRYIYRGRDRGLFCPQPSSLLWTPPWSVFSHETADSRKTITMSGEC